MNRESMMTEQSEETVRQTDCDRCRVVDAYLVQSDEELLCELCKDEKERP